MSLCRSSIGAQAKQWHLLAGMLSHCYGSCVPVWLGCHESGLEVPSQGLGTSIPGWVLPFQALHVWGEDCFEA